MATHQSYVFILLLISIFITISMAASSGTSDPQSKPNKPDSKPHLHNIIEALSKTGDFSNWAVVLSTTDPSTFPVTATLFIPSDDSLSNITSDQFLQFDPSTFAYHITPQQLTFSLLKTFKIGSRIPTLLPKKTILVTNSSVSNYTIDESRITHPDLYVNGEIVVHGIGFLLNYSVFGGGFLEDSQILEPVLPHDQTPKSPEADHNNGYNVGLHRSVGKRLSAKNCILIIMSIMVVLLFDHVRVLFAIFSKAVNGFRL